VKNVQNYILKKYKIREGSQPDLVAFMTSGQETNWAYSLIHQSLQRKLKPLNWMQRTNRSYKAANTGC